MNSEITKDGVFLCATAGGAGGSGEGVAREREADCCAGGAGRGEFLILSFTGGVI